MKYLVGVDGSEGSLAAATIIGRMAGSEDRILLYFSMPRITPRSGMGPGSAMLQQMEQSLTEAVFRETKTRIPEPLHATLTPIAESEPVSSGLLQAVDRHGAEILVVGAQGVSSGKSVAIGSTTRQLLHSSKIPVLVARPTRQPVAPGTPPRVLLAWDGSESSRQAADVVERIAWPAGTVGKVMTVIEAMFAGRVPDWLEKMARDKFTEEMASGWIAEHEEDRRQTHDALLEYAQKLPVAFRDHDVIVSEGYPAEEILHTVHTENIDLAVLGDRGRGAVARFLLGCTSERVVSNAPCSVLVVRQK